MRRASKKQPLDNVDPEKLPDSALPSAQKQFCSRTFTGPSMDAANSSDLVQHGSGKSDEQREPKTASKQEKQYAHYLLLERISESKSWLSTTELRSFLENQSAWGACGSLAGRTRTLQNWLKKLRALADDTRSLVYRELPSGSFEYRGVACAPMSLESACLALLAERLLDPLLPKDYVETRLTESFQASRQKIADHERALGRTGDAVACLVSRISLSSRGQRLESTAPPYDFTAAVSGAILKRRCLESVYKGVARRLHPYGLIYRDPKFYVLAVDDATLRADVNTSPKLYLCSRFSKLSVSNVINLVPDDFVTSPHVVDKAFGIPLKEAHCQDNNPEDFTLRIHGITDNLKTDLQDFPLSSGQRLEPEPKSGSCLLRASDLPITESLVEWILGRGSRVEVLAPPFLRKIVGDRLRASSLLYESDG